MTTLEAGTADETLTVEQVQQWVARVAAATEDDGHAHSLEDMFRAEVLTAIAAGAPNPHLLAAAVLETDRLKFGRWCA